MAEQHCSNVATYSYVPAIFSYSSAICNMLQLLAGVLPVILVPERKYGNIAQPHYFLALTQVSKIKFLVRNYSSNEIWPWKLSMPLSFISKIHVVFIYVVSTQATLVEGRQEINTYDEMLAELVANNFPDVSDIFSDSDSDSENPFIRKIQNKTVSPLSDCSKMIALMMTIMILKFGLGNTCSKTDKYSSLR